MQNFEKKEIEDDAAGSTESKAKLQGRRIVPSVDAIHFKVKALKALKMKGDKVTRLNIHVDGEFIGSTCAHRTTQKSSKRVKIVMKWRGFL